VATHAGGVHLLVEADEFVDVLGFRGLESGSPGVVETL